MSDSLITILSIISIPMLIISFFAAKSLRNNLKMNLLQSTTLGLLIWLPLSVAIFGVLLGLGTNLVQLLITKFGKLMGDLACGLSGTSSKELEDLLKKYKEELGKKVS